MKPFKLKLIYPKWHKLKGQTTFNLPPHGPVAFAATLPEWVEVSFTDENVEAINFDEECDGVALSMMLSTQVKRGWEIAEEYHKRGKLVAAGGDRERWLPGVSAGRMPGRQVTGGCRPCRPDTPETGRRQSPQVGRYI